MPAKGISAVIAMTASPSRHGAKALRIINMSRVEICSLAYEGKLIELKEKIDLKPGLATKLDEVGDVYAISGQKVERSDSVNNVNFFT